MKAVSSSEEEVKPCPRCGSRYVGLGDDPGCLAQDCPWRQQWGSPIQLRFLRNMMHATPDGQVFPIRKELILWMLDRIEAKP